MRHLLLVSLYVQEHGLSVLRSSLSPELIKEQRLRHKREVAATWIKSILGEEIPTETDEAFRHSLSNGTILCRVLNVISPGTIAVVADSEYGDGHSSIQKWRTSLENLSLFLDAAQNFTTEIFSAADVEAAGERPQVVECILSLRDWYLCASALKRSDEDSSSIATPASQIHQLEIPGVKRDIYHSELSGAVASHLSPRMPTFSPEAINIVTKYDGANDGLTYLMQSCTNMLRSRMGMAVSPIENKVEKTHPDIALDAVGPVLETVLSNLTNEYERRLHQKDKDYKLITETSESLRNQVSALKEEILFLRSEIDRKEREENQEAKEKINALEIRERAEYEKLKAREESLLCDLDAKQKKLEEVERRAFYQNEQLSEEIINLREEIDNLMSLKEKYDSLKEENRTLYNLVQDLRGSIRVFCRIRPAGATGDTSQNIIERGEENSLAIYSRKHSKWHQFVFDRIFDEASSQEDIYFETKPLVRSVLDGYNVCIFAYGQTGSGKTFTMSGPRSDPGIYMKSLEDLFSQREDRSDEANIGIKIQLLEVYNENIRDLLVSEKEARMAKPLSIVATRGSGSNVPDAIQVEVDSVDDVLEALDRGARNRAVAETKMNERSSRSHQILTIMVDCVYTSTHERTLGCLHLIDLAGSERVARSGAQGQQLLEAQHINRSLSALGNVMQALAQKRDHVPYRDSKLTQLLQDSLAGSSKTMMFVHVAPEENSAGESLSTLNFGKKVTEITLGAAKRNVDSGASWELKERINLARQEAVEALREAAEERSRRQELEEEVERLTKQLHNRDLSSAIKTSRNRNSPFIDSGHRSSTDFSGGIRAHRPSRDSLGSSDIDSKDLCSSGLSRPPQVSPLNLSKLNVGQAGTPSSGRSLGISGKPSRIPTPNSNSLNLTARTESKRRSSPLQRPGSLTARDYSSTSLDSRTDSKHSSRLDSRPPSSRLGKGNELQTSSTQRRWM